MLIFSSQPNQAACGRNSQLATSVASLPYEYGYGGTTLIVCVCVSGYMCVCHSTQVRVLVRASVAIPTSTSTSSDYLNTPWGTKYKLQTTNGQRTLYVLRVLVESLCGGRSVTWRAAGSFMEGGVRNHFG
eukprot:scaffold49781_cov37-Prasinocladus_malaysianus.AAC.2